MTNEPKGIIAIYQYLDQVCDAMEKIKSRGDFENHEVFSPTSYHELEHTADYGASPVRWFTLTGALTGIVTGFVLPLGLNYDWQMVVGGKLGGIVSLPAYLIFAFELMVLFGAICTIAGMIIMGRLPDFSKKILDKRTTDDRFAIFVPGASLDGSQAELLRSCGAEEINPVG